MTDFSKIFCENVMRLLEERQILRSDLARASGVSPAMLTELAKGVANPKLSTMALIAETLAVPLPLLLMPPEDFSWQVFKSGTARNVEADLDVPPGCGYLANVILPMGKLEIVKEWQQSSLSARRRLKGRTGSES